MARKMLAFLFCPLITCFWVIPPLSVTLSTAASSSHAASSSSSDFVEFPNNKAFASCIDLPNLNSFLYWTYNPSSTTLHIAYRHTHVTSSTWVAWGINPTSKGMVGTQAVVAYQKPDGTVTVFTCSVDTYGTRLREGNLSLPVSGLSASFSENQMIIFAVFQLPENTTSVNYVWQDGPVSDTTLKIHQVYGNHLQSMATLNLSSEQASSASHEGNSKKTQLKITHGVLNTVCWGIVMPLRFMVAMYLNAVEPKTDSLWSKIHITLQLSGYLLGIAGGVAGLYLRILSSGTHYPSHMGIGITLFCLRLFQVSALFFSLAKEHKYIYLWNWIQRLTDYTVLLLSFTNIWIGFYILKPAKAWVIAYGVVSGAIIVATIILKIWKILTRDGKVNGANGEEINV